MVEQGQPTRQQHVVKFAADVNSAKQAAKALALAIGFETAVGEEIALVVSELATNLVKHTDGGTLVLVPISVGQRIGIQVESHDYGPGIRDVNQMLKDGVSTVGSLGLGLGTVNRLMDEFDIHSRYELPIVGTHIVSRRFVRGQVAPRETPVPLEFGVATRAHPLMNVNGDTFVIKQWGNSALIGIIDGVGHGQFAQRAAQSARHYVEGHYDLPLTSIFMGTGRACAATRGVVMALVRFDWAPMSPEITFTLCSVGNIEVRIIGKSEPMDFVLRRGIIGLDAPPPIETQHRWLPHYQMVLHSDGIASHWQWQDYRDLANQPAGAIAIRLVQRLAKDQDDATVLIAQSRNRATGNYNEH